MFDEKITQFSDLPLEDPDRKRTDILCTIIGALFGTIMFVLALALMSTDHHQQSNYPTDSDGVACNYGPNANYPLVYFPDIIDINSRVCLSRCPLSSDLQLICRTNSKVPACDISNIYSSQVDFSRLGGFCAPTDSAARDRLMQTANLQQKWNFLHLFDCIRISLLLTLAVGCIWMLLVQFLPRATSTGVTVLAIIALGILGITVLSGRISGMSTVAKLGLGLALIATAALFACFLCFYRLRNRLIGIFLDWATRLLRERCILVLYVFGFMALTAGLVVLCLFQHLAFLSHARPRSEEGDIYLKLTPNIPLLVLNLIEFIWGLQFLKDSFNFLVSGVATQWYTGKEPSELSILLRLLRHHFGSVAGGSFLNAFFNLINFALESLRCYRDGACPLFASCYDTICGCNRNFFEFVRSDVYAYINLTGIAYCNAARNCEHLIDHSHLFVGSQSVLYFYRISAYCFLVGSTLLATISIIEGKTNSQPELVGVGVSGLLSYCLLNYLVDLHPNIAEGIQISYLIEESLGSQDKAKPAFVVGQDQYDFKQEIFTMEKSYKDGQFC